MLCYGSEAWAIREQDINRVIVYRMKFMQKTAGYTK
jgi:hypothetical protein